MKGLEEGEIESKTIFFITNFRIKELIVLKLKYLNNSIIRDKRERKERRERKRDKFS